jgi:hypothetical protein
MNAFKLIFKLVTGQHIHKFSRPVISQYNSFNTRRIIYQCTCGKKEARLVYRAFGDPFPIETAVMLDNKEFNAILKYEKIHPPLVSFTDVRNIVGD